MKHNKYKDIDCSPQVNYYDDEDYLGYSGYNSANGCRRLFFILITFLALAIAMCIIAVYKVL